jgi:hypothetical protein
MSDGKITVEMLLVKIGQLVIQNDIAAEQIAELKAKISELEGKKEKS